MKYKETDNSGSFDAYGAGFTYKYHSNEQSLTILRAHDCKAINTIALDSRSSCDVRAYIDDINKATQIYALMFSNNTQIELVEILKGPRLKSIVKNAARLARYSYDLKSYDFPRFTEKFCTHFSLKDIEVRKIYGRTKEEDFYVAKIKTKKDNAAAAISESLHGIMKDLSEKTVQDLIVAEYGGFNQREAQNLLTVSTNLATISRILNTEFSPHRRIAKYSTMSDSDLEKNRENI